MTLMFLMKRSKTFIQTVMFSKEEESVHHSRINKHPKAQQMKTATSSFSWGGEDFAAVAAFLMAVTEFWTEAT